MVPCGTCKCPVNTGTFTRDGAAPHGQPGGRGPCPPLPDSLWALSPAWGSRRGRSVRRMLSQLISGSQQDAGMLEGLGDKAWHLGAWLKRVYLFVQVCMHVITNACQCMHVCVHTSVYLCMCSQMYLCMHVCMFLCVVMCVRACMFVCAHLCVCVHVSLCMRVCMFMCTNLCASVCMLFTYVSMHAHMHVCVCKSLCKCVFTCVYMCAYLRAHLCANVCVCLHMCVCAHMRVCVHIFVQVCGHACS